MNANLDWLRHVPERCDECGMPKDEDHVCAPDDEQVDVNGRTRWEYSDESESHIR